MVDVAHEGLNFSNRSLAGGGKCGIIRRVGMKDIKIVVASVGGGGGWGRKD